MSLRARAGRGFLLVGRVHAKSETSLAFEVNEQSLGPIALRPGRGWSEVGLDVPPDLALAINTIVVNRTDQPVVSYHWWVFSND